MGFKFPSNPNYSMSLWLHVINIGIEQHPRQKHLSLKPHLNLVPPPLNLQQNGDLNSVGQQKGSAQIPLDPPVSAHTQPSSPFLGPLQALPGVAAAA